LALGLISDTLTIDAHTHISWFEMLHIMNNTLCLNYHESIYIHKGTGLQVTIFFIELAKGGYLSAYRWNSGGTWKGRSWDQDLPNDSQVYL
jgi:hypothetical protein